MNNSTTMLFLMNILVSPPLHLSLIIAQIISFLALSQLRNTAKLLMIVVGLLIALDAFDNAW